MQKREYFQLLLYMLCFLLKSTSALYNNSPYLHKESFLNSKYVLEWFADLSERLVTFNITVETKGFIGFGLSKNGLMENADIVVGGVMPNGKIYFTDRHATGRNLRVDKNQDYILHEARESSTHTFLSFSRAFHTCDTEDVDLQIEGDKVSIIFAYGEDDSIGYHFQNRGGFETYLLDPDLTPRAIQESPPFGNFVDEHVGSIGDWKVWTISEQIRVPAEDTTYLCSIHDLRTKAKTH